MRPASVAAFWRGVAVALLVATVWMALTLSHGGFWPPDGGSDLHGYYLARYLHVARSLRTLHVPLWDPWEFCGTSFFGSPQSGVLYPPIPFIFALFAPWNALQLLWLFHGVLFAITSVRYLQRAGVGTVAAAIGTFVALVAIVRGVGGLTQPNFIAGTAWAPALLLAVDRLCDGGGRRGVAAFAVLAALQWASGYPDLAIDTAVLLGVYALLRGGGVGLPRRLATLGAGLALGATLAAVLLVPLWEAIGQSVRVVEVSKFAAVRMLFTVQSPHDLWQGVLRRYGIAAFALGAVGVAAPSSRRWAWLGTFGVALFALNRPLSMLYALPPFSGLRLTIGWGYVGPLFAGCLIASGLQWLLDRPTRAVRGIGVALAVIAAGNAAWLGASRPRTRPIVRPTEDAVAQKAETLATLRERFGVSRVLAGDGFVTGIALRHRLPSPIGNDPLAPRLVVDLLDRLDLHLAQAVRWNALAHRRDLLALLGVGLVAAPDAEAAAFEAAGFGVVSRDVPGERTMYRAPLPRARLVHEVIRVADSAASLEQVATHAADAAHVCVLEGDEAAIPVAPPPLGAVESVTLAVDDPETVQVDVTVAAPAVLVLTDAYFPGWRATVDDRSAAILRADHAFRGVALSAGAHRVVFRYAPDSIRIGAWISLVAAIAIALLAVTDRRRHNPLDD